ncbi:TPA: DUF550 domain-containing protein [Salmonella enterica]|nr:DUF550 domain-containing protein [Salmonella enterica]
MTTITKEWLQQTIAEFENTRDDIPFGLSDDDAKILIVLKRALASLERERIRREHAEWSDKTFGDVGPVGPLKHLSKEALEAAADPSDPLEWADMQFLLWDAQRRMGISDEFITRAMIEKLAINKTRQWPEPKDGEPRLHIKEQPAPVVPEEMPKGLAGQIVSLLAHNIGDKFLAQKIWNACRAAMLQGVEQPQNARQNIPDGNSPVIPDGYALVPIVPTEDMVINGFESEPDPHFSDEKVWAEYEALSGCRRAARRAELCWAAMIKAVPKPEGNNG